MIVMEEGKGPESLKPQVRSRPPILLTHGDRDEVIPIDALFMTTDSLAAAEVPCQWHLSIGLGHGIDGEALRQGGLFLTQSFGLPYPAYAQAPLRRGRPLPDPILRLALPGLRASATQARAAARAAWAPARRNPVSLPIAIRLKPSFAISPARSPVAA